MKRFAIVLALAAAGVAALATHHAASAAGGDNSDAAHTCNQGGYAGLIGTDGSTETTFMNSGDCTSYTAHGDTLVSLSEAAVCQNGAWMLLTTSNSTASFAGDGGNRFGTEAACLLYVGQGGTPVTPSLSQTGTRGGIIWGD
jgi:hypothetical protein